MTSSMKPDRYQVVVVGCLPQTYSFAHKPLGPMARDMNGTIGAAIDEQDAIMVLRPDRYVAAVLTGTGALSTAGWFNAMVDANCRSLS